MKITIAGSGAMGCRFGAALFEAGHQVTLLDGWREHVTAINEAGLRVTDATGTRTLAVPAVLFPDPPVVAEAADLVVVFAKATGTAAVAAAAAGAIGPSTLVLTLQNGLGNIEALLARVPADRLLAGHRRRSAPSCSGRGISERSGRARPCSGPLARIRRRRGSAGAPSWLRPRSPRPGSGLGRRRTRWR